jgi:SAM-dependent methyltransferase
MGRVAAVKCRHCASALQDVFVDLGAAPPSNAFLREQDLKAAEPYFPLLAHTCHRCGLVQLDEVQSRRSLFSDDYVYFSSYSSSWLDHARRYVDEVIPRLQLGPGSRVLEVASNDGYLLQYFPAHGIHPVGIEPTAGTARASRAKGIETIERFFGRDFAGELAAQRGRFDLVVANNVLAHVPDINDFVAGLREALAAGGAASLEFPHLLRLVQGCQFDTIYHEHFSYLSFRTVRAILASQGLAAWDVEQLPTHGGSLRVWVQHASGPRREHERVARMLDIEHAAGMQTAGFYAGFQAEADRVKNELLAFLLEHKRAGRTVVGYGAAAKGNTLLNYAGVHKDLLRFVVDASPHKQGRWLPGSRIPVVAEDYLRKTRPDVVLILPWNLRDEIARQIGYVRSWDARLAVALPRLEYL